jgi:hypothetical protein
MSGVPYSDARGSLKSPIIATRNPLGLFGVVGKSKARVVERVHHGAEWEVPPRVTRPEFLSCGSVEQTGSSMGLLA